MELITGTVALEYVERGDCDPQSGPGSAAFYPAAERQRITSLPDVELVSAATAGSSLAFDELVSRYRAKVMRLVGSMLGGRIEMEDVAQDIFVKVYLSLGNFRGDASFSTFLYTVTVNRCRDELRKSKLRRFFSFDEWFASGGDAHPVEENAQRIDGDERRDAIRRAMKRLPTHTQMLLHLREVEELSYKELAEIFDVEMGTIKSRLARARDRLREEIIPYINDGTLPGS